MSNNMWRGLAAAICLAVASVGPAHADGNNPVGTWLITVTFPDNPAGPPAPPPFKEFLTLHHNGTLTETNTTLHAHPVPAARWRSPPAKASGPGNARRAAWCTSRS
jgi:hypothetical protein